MVVSSLKGLGDNGNGFAEGGGGMCRGSNLRNIPYAYRRNNVLRGFLPGTVHAAAPVGLNVFVEMILAVVVGELVAGFDPLFRKDANTLCSLVDFRLAVRSAGVVDVPGKVAARRAVDGPLAVYIEEVPVRPPVCLVARNQLTGILDNEVALSECAIRDEPEARSGALHAEIFSYGHA